VIATGLTIGALTSLYVVPVIYTYVASAKAKIPRSAQTDADLALPSHPGISL
jgi:hypothetical protein